MQKKLLISISFLAMLLFAGVSLAAEMVNINKASAAAIQQNLVGIGPIKAEAIVSYRKKNGKFKSLDDLQNVTGLGPAIIKKNKRYLSMTKGVVAGDDKVYAAAKKQAGKSKATGTKKPAKKQAAAKLKKESTKTKAKANSKTTKKAETKTKAKPAKTAKKSCSGSTSTMSKTEKKACADKKAKAKKTAKKPAKKKTTEKKPAKKKKTAKPAS